MTIQTATKIYNIYSGGRNPDIGSKSARTQRRYKSLLANQTSLTDHFGFVRTAAPAQRIPTPASSSSSEPIPVKIKRATPPPSTIPHSTHYRLPSVPTRQESPDTGPLEFLDVEIRQESVTPPPPGFIDSDSDSGAYFACTANDATPPPDSLVNSTANSPGVNMVELKNLGDDLGRKRRASVSVAELEEGTRESEQSEASDDEGREGVEDWEDEMEEVMAAVGVVRGWFHLRELVKDKLVKQAKTLPAAHVNRLMIVRNFCTLRLKGYGWIEASNLIAEQWDESKGSNLHFARRVRALVCHYRVYEQFQIETRGGFKNCRSLLKDESVRSTARAWLTAQPSGQITPEKFCAGLTTKFFHLSVCPLRSRSASAQRGDG